MTFQQISANFLSLNDLALAIQKKDYYQNLKFTFLKNDITVILFRFQKNRYFIARNLENLYSCLNTYDKLVLYDYQIEDFFITKPNVSLLVYLAENLSIHNAVYYGFLINYRMFTVGLLINGPSTNIKEADRIIGQFWKEGQRVKRNIDPTPKFLYKRYALYENLYDFWTFDRPERIWEVVLDSPELHDIFYRHLLDEPETLDFVLGSNQLRLFGLPTQTFTGRIKPKDMTINEFANIVCKIKQAGRINSKIKKIILENPIISLDHCFDNFLDQDIYLAQSKYLSNKELRDKKDAYRSNLNQNITNFRRLFNSNIQNEMKNINLEENPPYVYELTEFKSIPSKIQILNEEQKLGLLDLTDKQYIQTNL